MEFLYYIFICSNGSIIKKVKDMKHNNDSGIDV